MNVILASSSPRRRELLEQAGLVFTVVPSPAEEIHEPGMGMAALCEMNAKLKASIVSLSHPDAVVIGADTLVFVDGEALGKPKSMDEARAMLRRLSGRVHQVCTGICLAGPQERIQSLHEVTEVTFHPLDEETIEKYLELTQPLDKAGAYGIQDHGEMIVAGVSGDYENVVGLPVKALMAALKGIGLPLARR